MRYIESCASCPYSKWTSQGGDFFEVQCKKYFHRIVGNYIKVTDRLPFPLWCKVNEDEEYVNTWHKLKPQVDWCDVTNGSLFHIPPCNGGKRFNIKVIAKTAEWFSYRRDDTNEINYMYKDSLYYRVMVKHKNYVPKFNNN